MIYCPACGKWSYPHRMVTVRVEGKKRVMKYCKLNHVVTNEPVAVTT